MLRRWQIVAASVALLVAAGLAGLLLNGDGSEDPPSAGSCDLVAAYGGIFEVSSSVAVEVSDANRAALLERVHACVESALAADTSARYRQIADTLSGPRGSASEQTARNFVEIELAAAIAGTDAIVQQRAVARRVVRGWLDVDDIVKRQGAGAVLAGSGWISAREVKHHDEVPAYLDTCKLAGVPVPGPFATDPAWTRHEELDYETPRYFFRSDFGDSDIWTYKNSASGGFCVMLVRRMPGFDIQYAGTICTDRLQTNACFFDNIVYDGAGTKRISWEEFKTRKFSELVHPKDGEDTCNTCHLGNNPFLVHPMTILGEVIKSMYLEKVPREQAFRFVGLDTEPSPWVNYEAIDPPIDPVTLKPVGCFKCHGIPQVTRTHRFCANLIQRAANKTMPPGHWPLQAPKGVRNFWPDDAGCFPKEHASLSEYFSSLVKLKAVCSGLAEVTCPQH